MLAPNAFSNWDASIYKVAQQHSMQAVLMLQVQTLQYCMCRRLSLLMQFWRVSRRN